MLPDDILALKTKASKGDAVSCYEMAILLSRDYYRSISGNVALELHHLIKRYLEQGCAKFSIWSEQLALALQDYSEAPSVQKMTHAMKLMLNSNPGDGVPCNRNEIAVYVNNVFPLLRADIITLFDTDLSEWKAYMPLYEAVKSYVASPSLTQYLNVLEGLNSYGQKYKNKRLIQELLCCSALQGNEAAMAALCKGYGINCTRCRLEILQSSQVRIIPIMDVEQPLDAVIATGDFHTIHFKSHSILIPKVIKYFGDNCQKPGKHLEIVVDSSNNESLKQAKYRLGSIIASIAVGLKRDISFEIVDLTTLGIVWDFTSCLDGKRVHITSSEKELYRSLERIDAEMQARVKAEGNFQTRLVRRMPLQSPVKVLVISDISGTLDRKKYGGYIDKLIANSNGAGFVPVLITDRKLNVGYDERYMLDCFYNVPMVPATDILRVPGYEDGHTNWFFKYLQAPNTPKENTEVKVAADGCARPGKNSSLKVEIGNDGESIVEFILDTVSHTHAFILGKSGSGKSVLLHNIVCHLISRYNPSDLELYLLDLKLGGVEFNRYKGIPHARVLLVDNSDTEIIVEIMKDIEAKMKERGRLLNRAGCNNVSDYNEQHPDDRLPQVVVFADECQQLFNGELRKNGNSQNHDLILNTLIKIAKEGRSQGIHLVMATQTLAGSDIPSGILNNISDFFLLSSVASDAERLVSGSSKYTSDLATGEVYYKHIEYATSFKGYYITKQKSDDILKALKSNIDPGHANQQIYLNGSQLWELKSEFITTNGDDNDLSGILGQSIDLSQHPVELMLCREAEENVLFLGLNETGNLSRSVMSLLASHTLYLHKNEIKGRIIVFDAYPQKDEARSCHLFLSNLAEKGYIEYPPRENWGEILVSIYNLLKDGVNQEPIILYILGQEMFTELRRDEDLPNQVNLESEDGDFLEDPADSLFSNIGSFSTSSDKLTYQTVIESILKDGPERGAHMVVAIDNIDKLLFSDDIPRRIIQTNFAHIVMTRTNEQATYKIGLSDSIHPERLCDDEERLRAFYYNSHMDKYKMYTPFVLPDMNNL